MPLCTFFLIADTDHDHETIIGIAISVPFAIIVVLLIITVAVCVIVKRFRKQNRKRMTAASSEITVQSPNNKFYATTSPDDVPTNFIKKKVKLALY